MRESTTFVSALHLQECDYISCQRLPWTGNRVVSREHRPPDGLADLTFSHSCHFVLSGNGVDLADALVEFLLSGSLDKNVEAVIAEHLRILGAAGNDFRYCPELLLRSEEHTSELQSLMRISYAVFCLKKKTQH